jgi:hypothetical protein
MMVKEQYPPPAARHEGLSEDQLWDALSSWTVMIKDRAGSHDGWFWSNPAKGQKPVDSYAHPFEEPISGFGLYCVRCHASAQSPARSAGRGTNEFTFASLRNVKGFPGEPLMFRVDDSWRTEQQRNRLPEVVDLSNEAKLASVAAKESATHPRCTESMHPQQCLTRVNEAFLQAFPLPSKQPVRSQVQKLPPITHDHVPRKPKGSEQGFITSNQCMSCHAGITEPFGPTMFLPTGESAEYGEPGVHFSPYGEWRWTPMGLAGRDPVFFAQLESELTQLKKEFPPETASEIGRHLVHTCMGCHGVMGRRQFDLDQQAVEKPTYFALSNVFNDQVDPRAAGHAGYHYGALARDGISCAVCHRMQPREQPANDTRPYLQFFLETSITGNFQVGPPGELFGPFKDNEISPYPMEHAIAMKPKHSPFIKSSQLCGTCHTVNLPSVDKLHDGHHAADLVEAQANRIFKKFHHHVEQATYLEWLNSEFENEFHPENPLAKSCQDCHMSKGYHDEASGLAIQQLQSRIAAIQDESYPEAENIAPISDLTVRYRKEGYSRHNFKGLNVFLIEMFNQFDEILGVRRVDYMTGSNQDLRHAVQDFLHQAKHRTAEIEVATRWGDKHQIEVEVEVRNLAGHRFPSGVGFRRAFLEVSVFSDAQGAASDVPVWSSGSTNQVGQIVDGSGRPLISEFFDRDGKSGSQRFQPHHQVITATNQVQIYETLVCNAKRQLNTSFIHGCDVIKDNRLLPRGWKAEGPDPALTGTFLKATHPDEKTLIDPDYQAGRGSDKTLYRISLPPGTDSDRLRVTATLYYQAIPPYFLKNLFDTSPEGEATQRLYYLCSNLVLEGTPIADWKLKVVTATNSVEPLRLTSSH